MWMEPSKLCLLVTSVPNGVQIFGDKHETFAGPHFLLLEEYMVPSWGEADKWTRSEHLLILEMANVANGSDIFNTKHF